MASVEVDGIRFEVEGPTSRRPVTCPGCGSSLRGPATSIAMADWMKRHAEGCGAFTLGFAELANGEVVRE